MILYLYTIFSLFYFFVLIIYWRAGETLSGVTQLKIGDICLCGRTYVILYFNVLLGQQWVNDNIIRICCSKVAQRSIFFIWLQSTLWSRNLSFKVLPLGSQYVQILHVNNNHWVTVSNINFFSEKGERERKCLFMTVSYKEDWPRLKEASVLICSSSEQ